MTKLRWPSWQFLIGVLSNIWAIGTLTFAPHIKPVAVAGIGMVGLLWAVSAAAKFGTYFAGRREQERELMTKFRWFVLAVAIAMLASLPVWHARDVPFVVRLVAYTLFTAAALVARNLLAQFGGRSMTGYTEEVKFSGTNRYGSNPPGEDDVYTVAEFLAKCDGRAFIDYDGFGYPVKDGKADKSVTVRPSDARTSIPSDATHVVWFNR